MGEILYISKANSIPFVKREVSVYKNEENSLSFEGKQYLSQQAEWFFQPNEKRTIQVQSNLSNLKAKIYKGNVFQEEINPELKIEFLNQNITLDCQFVELTESNNVGIKFTTGNIYDNATDLNVIETYNVTGSLPDFALDNIVGKTITIDNVDYLVLSKIYDDLQASWCLEMDAQSYTVASVVMSLNYNIENFNVYEFIFDFEQYNNSELYILIQAERQTETLYLVSEKLKIGFFEGQIHILYKGTADKDIFYSTGIFHSLRVPYDKITPYTIEESESQKNDNDAYLIDTQTNEGTEFSLSSIPFKKYRQLVLALNHSILFIDGIGSVKDGEVSKEDNEETNLSDVTFQSIKAFSEKDNKTEFDKHFQTITTPNLLKENGGFITETEKYLSN